MGGIVIAFPGGRASTRRGAGTKSPPRRRRQRPQLKAQMERISALLEELDALSGASIKVPPAMLAQARDSICNAEQVLALRLVPDTAPSLLKQEDDPQPYVDPEALERLFNPRGKYQ